MTNARYLRDAWWTFPIRFGVMVQLVCVFSYLFECGLKSFSYLFLNRKLKKNRLDSFYLLSICQSLFPYSTENWNAVTYSHFTSLFNITPLSLYDFYTNSYRFWSAKASPSSPFCFSLVVCQKIVGFYLISIW